MKTTTWSLLNSTSHLTICFILSLMIGDLVIAAEGQWLEIGNLQNFYQAHGCEPEEDFGNEQQYGLRWNALYDHQDMQAAKGFWIGVANYFDPVANTTFPYKVAHVGPRPRPDIEVNEFMPVEFEVEGRFQAPQIYVNAALATGLNNDISGVESYDSTLPADRVIFNRVHSSTGITMDRTIYGESQQNYDDFIISEYDFTNTGICNSDSSITHNATLEGVYFHWQYRNSIAGEGTVDGTQIDWRGRRGWGTPQNCRWGMNTMNDVIGEDPDNPVISSEYAEMDEMSIDEYDDFGNIMRAYYSWHGRHSAVSYDNIGSPNYQGWLADGMLGASQFAGAVVLHADSEVGNPTDDIYQPTTTQMIESNDAATTNNDQFSTSRMEDEYTRLIASGHNNLSHAESVMSEGGYADQYSTAGGYSQSWSFGPYTLQPGESIKIVIAEAVGGIKRTKNYEVGNNWYRSFALGESPTMVMPNGSITTDADEYKNAWVYTGRDSLIQTFRRAINAWDMGMAALPEPPPPPSTFEMISMSDHIILNWDNSAENYEHFAGYRVFRAESDFNRFYEKVFECGTGTDNPEIVNSWPDFSVIDTTQYLYYLVSFDDGTRNQVEPGTALESGKFWTRSSVPVALTNNPLVNADLYVDPTGNDENSGLSPSEPLQHINTAIERILASQVSSNKIYLVPGIYSPLRSGESFPIRGKAFVTIVGDPDNWAIIDADDSSGVFDISNIQGMNLENMVIKNGFPSGITSRSSEISLQNLRLESNTTFGSGGGIRCTNNSNIELENVTITDNYASLMGGGIYRDESSWVSFSTENRCNIFLNNADYAGDDIAEDGEENSFLVVDTFSVMNPSDYHAYGSGFETDILVAKQTQIDADLYVNPLGNDLNSGQSVDQAFKTIEMAIKWIQADETNHHTIHLSEGIYSPAGNGEAFPLNPRSYVSLIGAAPETTILDAEESGNVISLRGDHQLTLKNLLLTNGNSSAGGMQVGGGLYCLSSTNILMQNVDIVRNSAGSGGGIYCILASDLSLTNVNVKYNGAFLNGGGIYISESTILFDSNYRSTVYGNECGALGQDLFSFIPAGSNQNHNVVLDTFSVMYPIEEYAYPIEDFTFNILNGMIAQAEADLYVSPFGSNDNDGLSTEHPLKTIVFASELIFADQTCPHTINLMPGVFSVSSNGEAMPVRGKSFVSISGDPEGGSIIDAEGMGQAVLCENVTTSTISDVHITGGLGDTGAGIFCIESSDLTFSGLTLDGNTVVNYGGGLYAENSSLAVEGSYFSNNRGKYGAGLATLNSDINIMGSVFSGDSARFGAAIYLKESYATLDHLTVSENETPSRGAALTLWGSGQTTITNSILWGNGGESIYIRPGTDVSISYSDIEGGAEAVNGDSLHWLDGNLNLDPLFCLVAEGNFQISENSPCLEAGENGANMGALGIGCTVAIDENTQLPLAYALNQNYPNPFNPMTTITYNLPETAEISLIVYDIMGREVAFLVNRQQSPGYYRIEWNGLNSSGIQLGTGLYFCRMEAGIFSQTIKMIYLK